MRILKLMLILVCFTAGSAFAQQTQKQTLKTVKISVPTVQCGMCKARLHKYFAKEEGVQSFLVDIKKKTATIKYYTDRTNVEHLKTAIANVGYDADNVKAAPDAYEALPICCKKPEDGGGHENPVKK
jgi:mercuric ion binding protein